MNQKGWKREKGTKQSHHTAFGIPSGIGMPGQKYVRWTRWAGELLFPCLLLIYPLLWANQGIELADSMYSLTNFRHFPVLSDSWTLATFLANVTGFFLMKLPFGGTLLGISLYTRLLISVMALLSYYFLKGKMPAWMAFLGEWIAISFCWCPTTILYNYLTYLLFLAGCILLYRGLIWEKRGLLVWAGVCLGLNVMVRIPNIVEAALIVAVFYYGRLTGKEKAETWKDAGCCVAGFFAGFLAVLTVICIRYGSTAWFGMFRSLGGYSATDESYSPFSMITSVLASYGRTLIWVMILGSCMIAGWIFFRYLPKKLQTAGKVVYCLCIPVLIRLFWGRGMFTFTYYNYRSMYEWGMLFLYLVLLSCILVLADDRYFRRDRLLALIVLLVVLVTPIGSNNDTMPALNNLFLAAPFAIGTLGRLMIQHRRRIAVFPVTALVVTVIGMTLLQGTGFRSRFAFGDGIYGEKRDAKVENSVILTGMRTRAENAQDLNGLFAFLEESTKTTGRSLITFGNAPGLHFLLDMRPGLSHGWPDLDTFPAGQMRRDLEEAASDRPLVILYQENGLPPADTLEASGNAAGMEKWQYLEEYLEREEYTLLYENRGFLVFG